MKYKLIMKFKTSKNKIYTINLYNVKKDLPESTINYFMDQIITLNLFCSSNGYLMQKHSCYLFKEDSKQINII